MRVGSRGVRRASYSEAIEQLLELLGGEIPGELGQQIVHVLFDRFVFAARGVPDLGQVVATERLLFDDEAKELFELFHVLRLVEAVAQENVEDLILFNPLLEAERTGAKRTGAASGLQ